MQHMKNTVAGLVAAGLIVGGGLVAAQNRDEPTVGSTVTLTSCVEKGQSDGTYVLTHVADVPVHPPTKGGKVVYWLDKDTANKLRSHVGHQLRVMGKITDVDKKEIEVKKADDGGLFVEIEGPGRDVRTSLGTVGVAAAGPTEGKTDIVTTVVKLKVDKLEMVSDRCNLTR